MRVIDTALEGVKIIEPSVYTDSRGSFVESFNQSVFDKALGSPTAFVQDNESRSIKGVLRGLHYQIPPKEQGKLVRVSHGDVFDVVVDIRPWSMTFGRWVGVNLSSSNAKQLWIPTGFAHGFYVLSELAIYSYKTTEYYSPLHERSILWNDKNLDIDWQLSGDPVMSEKDKKAPSFDSLIS